MNMEKAARRQVKDTTAGKKFQAAEGSNECVCQTATTNHSHSLCEGE
jgi:hypothetical protein